MYTQPQLFTGDQLAQIGQDIALANANNKISNWQNDAIKAAKTFCKIHPKGHFFQVEDIRFFAYENKYCSPPPNERAWGFISKFLTKNKLAEAAFRSKVSNAKAHAAWAMTYRII